MKRNASAASTTALCGILAALAIIIMAMGTIIPVATYVCPVLCMLLLQMVKKTCGARMAWAWYGAVAILSLLFAPDKEAAIVFLFLGYYPIIKHALDRLTGRWLYKLLYFNGVILIAYWLMLNLVGIDQVIQDLEGAGTVMTVMLLAMGNLVFVLLDRLLGMKFRSKHFRG